jgi:hypothetical protein
MFLRKQVVNKHGRDYTYLKVVESTRRDGKVVQKCLLNLGSVNAWPEGKLEEAVRLIERFLGLERTALRDVQMSDCRRLGPFLALAALWEQLGLGGIIERALLEDGARVEIPVAAYARAMVFNRLVDPCSKRAVSEWVAEQVQVPGLDPQRLSLHGYYRALAQLDRVHKKVEEAVHLRVGHLFNRELSLVFYDLTSSYFEGSECPLARHGHSREHRPDCLQIEIGLLVDAEGIPIGHEVFEGNLGDVSTVLPTLARLKEDFGVGRCIFVGDYGMASAANLKAIAARGYEYITSLALRGSGVAMELLASLPPRRSFRPLKPNLWVHPLRAEGGVRYIAGYNPNRARASQRHRREHWRACVVELRRLQAARPKASGRCCFHSMQEVERAADRFVRQKHCSSFVEVGLDEQDRLFWRLDREALRRERARDGLIIFQTNSPTLTDDEVAIGYRTLWRVENAFRHIKDPIRLRPIRHWNEACVRGHVFVCVLAYLLERLLDLRLEEAGVGITGREAIETLDTLSVATLSLPDQMVRRRSQITPAQQRVLTAVGVREVPEIW